MQCFWVFFGFFWTFLANFSQLFPVSGTFFENLASNYPRFFWGRNFVISWVSGHFSWVSGLLFEGFWPTFPDFWPFFPYFGYFGVFTGNRYSGPRNPTFRPPNWPDFPVSGRFPGFGRFGQIWPIWPIWPISPDLAESGQIGQIPGFRTILARGGPSSGISGPQIWPDFPGGPRIGTNPVGVG